MDLEKTFIGDIRDKKLLQLYTTLCQSDLKGNYEDTYTLELMYAIMCVDLIKIDLDMKLKPNEMTLLARNVVRLVDVNSELSIYSMPNWTLALMTYMKNNNLDVKKINKMSYFDLNKEVEPLVTKGDE